MVASQSALSMGFPRQEYWSSLPFPSPKDLSDPGVTLSSPALVGGFFITEPPAKHNEILLSHKNEILPFETMCINCEGILQIEKSLIEKDENCKISHTYGILKKKAELIETESKMIVKRAQE